MKRTVTFECGERTCAVEPGKFCRFVVTRRCGTVYECGAFNGELYDEGGWLMRCPACLAEFPPEGCKP